MSGYDWLNVCGAAKHVDRLAGVYQTVIAAEQDLANLGIPMLAEAHAALADLAVAAAARARDPELPRVNQGRAEMRCAQHLFALTILEQAADTHYPNEQPPLSAQFRAAAAEFHGESFTRLIPEPNVAVLMPQQSCIPLAS